jgi:hypothetical protein
MNVCKLCGSRAGLGEHTCATCGAAMPSSGEDARPRESDTTACAVCGLDLVITAAFCSACGNPIDSPDQISVPRALNALERILTPGGSTVLLENPLRKRFKRVEVYANEMGQFGLADRDLLVEVLTEVLAWDGYLHSEVTLGNEFFSCVWQIINGGIFALSDEHASALLYYFDPLLPEGTIADEADDTADAPSLTSS